MKVGCCGFSMAQAEYYKNFPLVEIQETFYKLPRLKTAQKWRQAAPQGFEFTMKAWQLITHEPASPTYRRLGKKIAPEKFSLYGSFRLTEEVREAWHHTADFARALGASRVVFQCPPSFHPSAENIRQMRSFFEWADRQTFQFVWEPRGPWPKEVTLRLCRDLQLVHGVDPFKDKALCGDLQYFRLHGIGGYGYRYSDGELRRLAEWAEEKPSYVLFNNRWMKEDASRFMEILQKDG